MKVTLRRISICMHELRCIYMHELRCIYMHELRCMHAWIWGAYEACMHELRCMHAWIEVHACMPQHTCMNWGAYDMHELRCIYPFCMHEVWWMHIHAWIACMPACMQACMQACSCMHACMPTIATATQRIIHNHNSVADNAMRQKWYQCDRLMIYHQL